MGGVCLRHEKIFKKGQHMSSYLGDSLGGLKRKEAVSVPHFHTCDSCFKDLPASKFDFSYYGFIGFDCARYLCDSCASFVGEELKPWMMVINFVLNVKTSWKESNFDSSD